MDRRKWGVENGEVQGWRWVADEYFSFGGSALPVVVEGSAVSAHAIIGVKVPSWMSTGL